MIFSKMEIQPDVIDVIDHPTNPLKIKKYYKTKKWVRGDLLQLDNDCFIFLMLQITSRKYYDVWYDDKRELMLLNASGMVTTFSIFDHIDKLRMLTKLDDCIDL